MSKSPPALPSPALAPSQALSSSTPPPPSRPAILPGALTIGTDLNLDPSAYVKFTLGQHQFIRNRRRKSLPRRKLFLPRGAWFFRRHLHALQLFRHAEPRHGYHRVSTRRLYLHAQHQHPRQNPTHRHASAIQLHQPHRRPTSYHWHPAVPANGAYYILGTTNAALPLDLWTRLATNHFDSNGNFSFTNSINPSSPREFYLIQLPLIILFASFSALNSPAQMVKIPLKIKSHQTTSSAAGALGAPASGRASRY